MIKQSGLVGGLVLLVVAVLLLGGSTYYFRSTEPIEQEEELPIPVTPPGGQVVTFDSVQIPLFTEGGDIVCGVKLNWLTREVTPSISLIDATLMELFSLPDPVSIDGVSYQNPIGYQITKTEFPPLRYLQASIENGVASIYLEGSLTGVGTCYDPLPAIQLEALVKQFDSVQSVRYFLNGESFDPASIADQ